MHAPARVGEEVVRTVEVRGIVLSFSFLKLFRNRNIFFHFFFSGEGKVDGISSLTISPVLLNVSGDESEIAARVVLLHVSTYVVGV